MTVFTEIIHQTSQITPPEVVYEKSNSLSTLTFASLNSSKHTEDNVVTPSQRPFVPRPMKFYLLDQDTNSRTVWHQCAESLGIAFQLVMHHEWTEELPRDSGIVVVDRSVCEHNFVRQIERFCLHNRRQQLIVTGDGLTLDQAVDLMRIGVSIALEKPLNFQRLTKSLPGIVQQARAMEKNEADFLSLDKLFRNLTARERQVLDLVLEGVHNRTSAERLGVSVRTIEARRAKVYRKLECNNLAELVRKIERLETLKATFAPHINPVNEISSFGGHHLERNASNQSKSL